MPLGPLHSPGPRSQEAPRSKVGGRLHPFAIHTALLVGVIGAGAPVVVPAPPEYSITLNWTAPGDDGQLGRAQAFDLRYSRTPITESNFVYAAPASGLPAPGPAGTRQSAAVDRLEPNTVYYFALKTCDEAGNWSPLSNVVRFPTITTGVGDQPLTAGCSLPSPNPARTMTRLALALPQAGEVEVDVFSVSGRHVRSLASGWRPAGPGELEWDLKDEHGGGVAAGVYLVRARLPGKVWNRRVTVIR